MNVFSGIGRLAKDPEMSYSAEGVAKTKFTLVIDNPFKKDNPSFIPCICFKKTAEIVAQYTNQGDQLGITGNISTFRFEKDGAMQYGWNVVVDRIDFCRRKGDSHSNDNADE